MLNKFVFKSSPLDFAESNKSKYSSANPFPHIVIDEAMDKKILESVYNEFPSLEDFSDTRIHKGRTDNKMGTARGDKRQGEQTKSLLRYLNSSEFIDFLQAITSIKEPLIPDPHFIGGGMHQSKKGGFLKVHADFSKHLETGLDRRLNVLLYLNKNWDKSFVGELQLFDKELKFYPKKILPIFNRMVIFNTNDYTYHGHPDPTNCPENTTRNSLALYYFSNGRPSSEIRSRTVRNSTIYIERKGEKFSLDIKYLIYLISPPILFESLRKIKSKFKKYFK